ncbi:MAG: DsbA family protein [Campylobacteraceae bacterium]
MKYIITAIVAIVILFGGGALWYKNKQEKELNAKLSELSESLVRDYSLVYGSPDAKVTIVEFLDPACETCAQFYPLLKDLVKKHDGKVKIVYRYAPFHKNSDFVIALLETLRLQDKFDDGLSKLFEHQNLWTVNHESKPELVLAVLMQSDIGIDFDKAFKDLESPEIARRLDQDYKDLTALGVDKTPGFFVNGKPLIEFGYKQLVDLVEREIKAVY